MTYKECTDYLFSLHRAGIKLGLERVTELSGLLGRPQDSLRFIHIAGTNGKGSTASFLESILRHSGLRTGLYTSPHLMGFNERIRVNGANIAQEDIIRLTLEVKEVVDRKDQFKETPFFEFTTLMALLYFAREKVDMVVWETGLGGRLDATNIVIPECSVITGIGLDHSEYLGNSLEEVAGEKAGIIKEGVPLVLGAAMESRIQAVFFDVAEAKRCPVHVAGDPMFPVVDRERDLQVFDLHGEKWEIALKGIYQPFNASLALKICAVLKSRGWGISRQACRTGLLEAAWPGRFDVQMKNPLLVIDGAHNPEGLGATLATWKKWYKSRPGEIIFGCMSDKDSSAMAALLDLKNTRIHLVPVPSVRGMDPGKLQSFFYNADVSVHDSPGEALESARASGRSCLATGSLYLAGELLSLMKTKRSELVLNG